MSDKTGRAKVALQGPDALGALLLWTPSAPLGWRQPENAATKLCFAPSSQPTQLPACRSVEVDGQSVAVARAGDGADVVLTGIDTTAVAGGSVSASCG